MSRGHNANAGARSELSCSGLAVRVRLKFIDTFACGLPIAEYCKSALRPAASQLTPILMALPRA
eukprot:6653417-Alexandrium_andersonii.AAC.1